MLKGKKRIHLIGIGGIGVSGVARALLRLGHEVTGSDVRESQLTLALRDEGATVHIGHDAQHIVGAEIIVHSTAIPDGNCELVAARASDAAVVHRAEVLGAILAGQTRSVGVVGTHGKGTVASAITWILEAAGESPNFIIGGLLENLGAINARLTHEGLIVAEVDESDGSLRHVHPNLVVINNLEADHLNYYESLAHIQDTVVAFLHANPRLERVFVNIDSPGAAALASRIDVPVTTFGRGEAASLRGVEITTRAMSSTLTIKEQGAPLVACTVGLPGLYNVDNALAATAVCRSLGVDADTIGRALGTFRGLENRFTVVEVGARRVIKDYISHPTGIRRVLAAAKEDGRHITAVFKPYRFTMINYLQDDYAEAFHDADHTVITELYTAGEVPIPGIDTAFLCDKIRDRGPQVTYVQEMDEIVSFLHANVSKDGQVVFFGGDDLFQLADRYVAELRG